MQAETRTPTGKIKLNHIQRILTTLDDDLSSPHLTPEQRREALEQLKIHGRDPKDAGPIFTKEGIGILTKHGLTEKSSPSSLEALRCLANAMLLEPRTRQIFVNLGCAGQAAERLKISDSDNEFLISRILFLLTYESNLNFDPLFNDHDLGESINAHIARHTKEFSQADSKNGPSSFDQAALSESLKLLFNLSTFYPQHVSTFTASSENIRKIIYAYTSQTQKKHMRSLLLPQQSDRDLPLGQSDTLPSKLLRLSTSPAAPKLREGISSLLFELSDQDATTFVRNVGYGYAAGFLLSHGMAVPESAMKARHGSARNGDGEGGEATAAEEGELVNPVTGQKLSKEEEVMVDTGPEMSEEEKEREAERLFVLFERLRATGVVSVENPVREAVERGAFDGRGRVEEVDDHDHDHEP
ncbi:hypothetical protein GJ744_007592 [Endocarpon pusillum]|uniref:Synembryn-A n=1 Tax=Endocarpon pusillum TaxID=364733 RepID=A0A8H7AMK5_9EURO|nr:hypothetical protein GJ744_007592 [Endocarpon pusillum]